MKSTGLFGKNSGRVGGVVYSNYRGQQIVRSYQPQVKNPNSKGQIAQRSKFKLVSQVGASLGKEIAMSFRPNVAKESPRNAFVKEMLKKTTYVDNDASLPIEEIVLTNSKIQGFSTLYIDGDDVRGVVSQNFTSDAKVRCLIIAYSDGGEIVPLTTIEPTVEVGDYGKEFAISMSQIRSLVPSGFSNVRLLTFVYEPMQSNGVTYGDYETLSDEATLEDVLKVYTNRVDFSETRNIQIPQNV